MRWFSWLSVRTSFRASSQGIHAGKRIVDRKRSIVADTLGLLLAVRCGSIMLHRRLAHDDETC
jgi:hypothetical protein